MNEEIRKKQTRWNDGELESLRRYIDSPNPLFLRPRRLKEYEGIEENDLSDYLLSSLDVPFSEALLSLIDKKGYTDVEVYKSGKIDRRVFSKIRSSSSYQPSRNTVIRLCLGMKSSVLEALLLLEKAGFTLSKAKKEDLVVLYCLEHHIYEVDAVNEALELLGIDKRI